MTRLLYTALGTLVALAAVLALAVGAFLGGLDVDGEFLRAPIERALTAAFDVPTRIEGPVRLRTGRAATVSADALVLADPSGAAGATLARGIAPRARIDVAALLRRSVLLEEVSGERLELALRRQADGRANWRQLFSAPGGPATVSFAGIERLRIGAVVGSYQGDGGPPLSFAIADLDGAVPREQPLRASGTAAIGERRIGFDLRTASLDGLAPAAGLPLQGTLTWSGVQARLDGTVLDGGRRLEASIEAAAADAAAPLAALGVVLKEPGALALRARLSLTATRAEATEFSASLGASSASGAASIAWDSPGLRLAFDLHSDLLDARPFVAAAPPQEGRQALVQWLARLDALAAVAEVSMKLAADRIDGLPVTVERLRLDLQGAQHALAGTLAAAVAGIPVDATLDYDARRPQRTLAARIDSGAASTASLPAGKRQMDVAGSAGRIRGRLSGSGADPAAIVASLQGEFDAHQVRWSLGQRRPPVEGRFDLVRVALRGSTASAEVSGRIRGESCRLRISGGAAAPLLAGRPWPMQLSASCPNERLGAKGRITLAGRRATAELDFDVAADRRGPMARATGLPPAVPYPVAARGALRLETQRAQVRLDDIRAGRSGGSGELHYPLGGTGTPRLRLALATLSLDEFAATRADDDAPAAAPGRTLLNPRQRVPDADLELTAERVELGDARLAGFRLEAAVRARAVRAAPFALDWEGIGLHGQLDADFGGAVPRLNVEATAQDADLRPLLERIGADGARVHAGRLTVAAKAEGNSPRELLAAASLDAAIDRARIELPRPLLPGKTGRGSIDATFRAAAGQPSKLAARGKMDGRPFELAAEGPPVDALGRHGAARPFALRSTIGDVRLEADGSFAGDGSAGARVHLAGARLDELGRLVGFPLPPVQPYAASAEVRLAPGSADVSDLQASFGNSRLTGRLRVEQRDGRRALHSLTLHAPELHLEDIGAGQWLGPPGNRAAADAGAPSRVTELVERLLEVLPRADVEASMQIGELLGGGQPIAGGKVLATVNAGALHARLLEVQAQQGTANAELRIDAGASPPSFSLRADARDIEYGSLAQALNPSSSLSGTVDAVVDLSAQALPADLKAALLGTVDMAAYPREMRPDALGLWGAGLLPAILRAVDRDSQAQVHCSVIGFAVADGKARSDGFFVETTSVRIIGDLEVRLGSWEMEGRIDPRPRTRRLFAISPRLQIGGALGSPSLSVAPESVVLVPLRFASPLGLFARDWLGRGGRGGGKADCQEAFARLLETHQDRAAVR